nr:isoform 2 of lysm domain-containing gpi-anchored protein 1 [Quercus suber]
MSTTYRVQEADTAESVSHGYGGIVSAEQITIVNGINGINGISHSNFSYLPKNRKVPPEIFDDVEGVDLAERGAPCHALFGFGLVVEPEACSSKNLNWYNESLIVPNGSYALTANNCIKCNCGTSDLNLQCFPSGIAVPCSHLQCKGSNLFIGDAYVNQTAAGCNVSTCMYRGHSGGKIFRRI